MTGARHCIRGGVAAVLTVGAVSAAGADAGHVLFDEWYEITIDGNKVGSVHQAIAETTFEGAQALRAIQELRTTFLRDGVAVESVSTTETLSRESDLAPIGFNQVSLDAGQKRSAAGRITDRKGFVFETKIGGKVNEKEASLPDGTIFSSTVERVVRQNLRDGWTWSKPVIMESDVDVANAEVKLLSAAKAAACPCPAGGAGGGCGAAKFVSQTSVAGLESIEWRDGSGRPVCVSVPAMKGLFTLVDRERAVASFDPFDIFTRSLMKPDRPIESPQDLDSLTLHLSFKDAPAAIPEDERQKITSRDEHSLTLTIARAPSPPGVKRPVDAPELANFRRPTEYEQSDAPEIRAKAKELVWAVDDAIEAARTINVWVHGFVRAGMGKGYLSALEVLRGGEGDCTEYSVLASAVAKAAGLPTRLVNGVVYVDGKFGFHEWVEVWVGYWHPFDPTLNESSINPTHIKLWTGVGEPGELRNAAVAVLGLYKGVKIKVVETKYGRR